MPFEIPQLDRKVEPKFKKYAQALLIGARLTGPCRWAYIERRSYGPYRYNTCAIGAMVVGLGK